ncbi:MAG: hypothetical protein IRZ11_07080 [Clostridia bacterium]|nr:hypothetical protein [Clostridia bacterium]
MVKVTILYNLSDEADHDRFLAWRVGEHQAENAAGEGVVRTDFYVAQAVGGETPRFRYITEVYYRDRRDMERHFLNPEMQTRIRRWIAEYGLKDFTVLCSEEYATSGEEAV